MQIQFDIVPPKTPLFTGDAEAVVSEELRAATEESVLRVRTAIIPLTPVNLGPLRGGTQTSVTIDQSGPVGRIFNPIAYANPMNTGAAFPSAGPPAAALELWVRRKLGVSEEEAAGVAFVIARSIKRRGLKGRRFFGQGWEQTKPVVEQRYDQANARIAQRLSTPGGGA
jgi:hypothetical protein